MQSGRPNLAEYTLVLATPEQVVQHSKAEYVPWSKGQDFQTFYDEQVTRRRTGPWAKDHALLTWVLVKRTEPQGEAYACCETYRRRAFIKRQNGVVEPGVVYGIASVVTPVQHHRQGYATHMLRLLHYMLGSSSDLPPFPSEWGTPPPALPSRPVQSESDLGTPAGPAAPASSQNASFLDTPRPDYLPAGVGSILWSDVGSHFYSRCTIGLSDPGWVMAAKDNTVLSWELSEPPDSALKGWEVLYQRDLPEVARIISAASQKTLRVSTDTTWAADAETSGLLDFTTLRNVWSELALRPRVTSLPIGLRRVQGEREVIALFTTHNNAIAKSLLVTLLHNVTPEILPSLLDALDVMGRKEGRTVGIMWGLESSDELVSAWQKLRKVTENGQRPEKDGHLLGVAWYGPKDQPKGRLLDTQMWGWC